MQNWKNTRASYTYVTDIYDVWTTTNLLSIITFLKDHHFPRRSECIGIEIMFPIDHAIFSSSRRAYVRCCASTVCKIIRFLLYSWFIRTNDHLQSDLLNPSHRRLLKQLLLQRCILYFRFFIIREIFFPSLSSFCLYVSFARKSTGSWWQTTRRRTLFRRWTAWRNTSR